jgi:hypothetical protein
LLGRALRLVGTWPRRFAALFGSALAAWAVAASVSALVHQTSKRVGLAAPALSVSVVADPDRIQHEGLGHVPEFVIQRPIERIGPPPNGDKPVGRYVWAHAMGGIDAFETAVRLVVRGNSDAPIVLNDLRVQVVARRPVVHGTLVSYFGLGAGQPVRYFNINLDPKLPSVKFVGDNDATKTFFPYQVSKSDVEVFDVLADLTRPEDVSWRLLLDYSAAGEDGTLTIDNHGAPFRTTTRGDAEFWKAFHRRGTPPQEGYGWRRGRWMSLRS